MRYLIKLYLNHYTNPKIKIIFFLFLTILLSFLELVVMGLLYTLVKFINNESINEKILLLNTIVNEYIQINTFAFIIVILLILFFTKLIIQLFFSWKKNSFTWNLYIYFSTLLTNRYLHQNYKFFLKNISSSLINNIYLETRNFAFCCNNFINFFSELIIVIFLMSLLFYNELIISLYFLFLILSIVLIYNFIFKKYFLTFSNLRIRSNNTLLQFFRDIFDGIKIIKINNVEKYFIEKIKKQVLIFSDTAKKQSFFTDIPKASIDLIFIFILILSFIFYYLKKDFFLAKSSSLVLIIFIFIRILPSVNRIIVNYQNIIYYQSTFLVLNKILSKFYFNKSIPSHKNKIFFNKNIIIKNCSYKHLKQKNYFFQGLDIKIDKNDCVGVYGDSGSGKSTLIDLLSGLLKFTKGSLSIDKYNLKSKWDYSAWQTRIGYVSQSTFILRDSIKNNIAFGIKNDEINEKKVLEAIKGASLERLFARFNNNINSLIEEKGFNLSLGEQQRIGIARALYKDSQLYIFDEPTSSLDYKTANNFINFLDKFKKNRTIILITHNKNNLKICNKLIEIKVAINKKGNISRKIIQKNNYGY